MKQQNKRTSPEELEYKYGIDYIARFAALYEGVNLACDRLEKLGEDIDKNKDWIKPTAFKKYIDARKDDFKFEIQRFLNGEVVEEDEIYPWDKVNK